MHHIASIPITSEILMANTMNIEITLLRWVNNLIRKQKTEYEEFIKSGAQKDVKFTHIR